MTPTSTKRPEGDPCHGCGDSGYPCPYCERNVDAERPTNKLATILARYFPGPEVNEFWRAMDEAGITVSWSAPAAVGEPSEEMIEDGCRGMYGKHWDGPPEKMPGPEMKNVWRAYSRNCLIAALINPPAPAVGAEEVARVIKFLGSLAFNYRLNDCEDLADDDALEIPISVFREANAILALLSRRG